MKTWIALLRGINVGDARPLPMKELVVFQAAKGTAQSIGSQIARLIEYTFGFQVPVLMLKASSSSANFRAKS